MKNYKSYLLLALVTFSLSACGVKPSSVDAPQGNDKDTFPHTYPSDEAIKK